MISPILHGSMKRSDHHHEDHPRREERRNEQRPLVEDVEEGDVVVVVGCLLPGLEKVYHIRHRGRHPATSLVEEFVESLRSIGVAVRGGTVLDPVSMLEDQGAQPTILA